MQNIKSPARPLFLTWVIAHVVAGLLLGIIATLGGFFGFLVVSIAGFVVGAAQYYAAKDHGFSPLWIVITGVGLLIGGALSLAISPQGFTYGFFDDVTVATVSNQAVFAIVDGLVVYLVVGAIQAYFLRQWGWNPVIVWVIAVMLGGAIADAIRNVGSLDAAFGGMTGGYIIAFTLAWLVFGLITGAALSMMSHNVIYRHEISEL